MDSGKVMLSQIRVEWEFGGEGKRSVVVHVHWVDMEVYMGKSWSECD